MKLQTRRSDRRRYKSRLLREKVEIQVRSKTPDDKGGNVTTWPAVRTVRAHVRQLDGTETMIAGQNQSIATILVVCRFFTMDPELDTEDVRLRWIRRSPLTPKLLNVVQVNDLESAHKWLELTCAEPA